MRSPIFGEELGGFERAFASPGAPRPRLLWRLALVGSFGLCPGPRGVEKPWRAANAERV